MKKGFTLIEMLVVMGIIAVLIGAGMASYSSVTKKAQKSKGQELVIQAATALDALYQREGSWPKRILQAGSDGEFTPEISYELAKRNLMTLSYDSASKQTVNFDRCGIVTPWAQAEIKRRGTAASTSSKVPTGGTIGDHRVHFAVDTEGNGYVNASVNGEAVRIRATAVAWSCGANGEKYGYTQGKRRGGIYSWSDKQVEK